MTLEDLKSLLAKIQEDPSAVSDEQLADAVTAIREQVAAAEAAPGETVADRTAKIEALQAVAAVQAAVKAEQTSRTDAAAAQAEEMQRLLADVKAADAEPDTADNVEGDTGETAVVEEPQEEREPELIAASAISDAIADGFRKAFATLQTPQAKPAPQGRTARPGTTATPKPATNPDVATAHVYVGGNALHGTRITDTVELGRAIHEKWRGAYQARSATGRMPVAHVQVAYPDNRVLGSDPEANHRKIQALVSPQALVAAGGLCAPPTTLYDVEVIGSAARPVRDALARFQVERGSIQWRPNVSAASAVYGAGVWTLADDEAGTGEKTCYVVECPGIEDAEIEAIYSCLEFSNITARFDPETTAQNVQQGAIAHARLAENQLLAKIAAGSKLLTAPKVIGASRDIVVNLDKTIAYYRNRHRIEDTLSLTWMAPGWVKSLIRADLARQMAAGDWMEALSVADSRIEQFFTSRNVTPVWHMDGPAGLDEVQTITITGSPTGGSFTLTFNGETTAAIAYNATAAAVKSALADLDGVRAEDITTAGGPLPGTAVTVTFDGGQFDGSNVPQMTATSSFTGGTTPAVAVTTTTGGGGAIDVSGVSVASQTYGNASAAGTIPGFPDQIDSFLYPAGDWMFLDGGSLDLGLVRDSVLNAKNRYRQFMETFEGAANRGVESLRLVMTVQPTGETVGTASGASIVD